MSMTKKKTIFTTYTPLPPQITRKIVMETLLSHVEMIDLNPLVIERHLIKAPLKATAEEAFCEWYEITDQVSYLPGIKGSVKSEACFTDLPNGIQTHIYAPLGLEIRGNWTLQGSLPGEPPATRDLAAAAPTSGLYIREICEIRCNPMLTSFVKKTTVKAHEALVARFVQKSKMEEQLGARITNPTLTGGPKSGIVSSPSLTYSSTSSPSFSTASMQHGSGNTTDQSPYLPTVQLDRTATTSNVPSSDLNRQSFQSQTSSSNPSLQQSGSGGFPSPAFPSQGFPSPALPSSQMHPAGFADPLQQQQFQQFQQWQQFQQFQQQQQQMQAQQAGAAGHYQGLNPQNSQSFQSHNPSHFGAVEMSAETKPSTTTAPPSQHPMSFAPVELPADPR